jgi:hypothetical protein
MARLRPILLVAAAGLAVAACGSASRSGSGTSATAAARGGSLTVEVHARRGGPVAATRTIRCDGAAPDAACTRLRAAPGLLLPISAQERCTEIYGGPAVARLTGTFGGRAVDLTVTRADGCNVERWARLVAAGAIPADAANAAPIAPPSPTTAAGGATALQIDVWPDGVGGAVHHRYALGCDPVSGDLPNAAATCASLAAVPQPATLFAPPNPHKECPRGGAGNAVVAVRGEFAGRAVHLTSSLANGCELARFARLRTLGVVPAADVPAPPPLGAS